MRGPPRYEVVASDPRLTGPLRHAPDTWRGPNVTSRRDRRVAPVAGSAVDGSAPTQPAMRAASLPFGQ